MWNITLTVFVLHREINALRWLRPIYPSTSRLLLVSLALWLASSENFSSDPHGRLQIIRTPILTLEQYGSSWRKNSTCPSDVFTSAPPLKFANTTILFERWPVTHSIRNRGLSCHTQPFLALFPDFGSRKTPKGFKTLPRLSFR